MTTVLFDTNVVLDVLLDRQPHAKASSAAWAVIETGTSSGYLAAHAITTIHYFVRKELGDAKARGIIAAILRVFGIAAVDSAVIKEALKLSLADFEDAVTVAAARLAGCDFIVTRDPKGFRGCTPGSLTPEALLPILATK